MGSARAGRERRRSSRLRRRSSCTAMRSLSTETSVSSRFPPPRNCFNLRAISSSRRVETLPNPTTDFSDSASSGTTGVAARARRQ
ncbi:hypothetical protein BRADI_4g27337v3 [Brachypodium distachyon]|uniref:Uncharacterized protein n=1 Tax=Brachypodium distachyon TaxID=15368 RepID=A0A2K2CQK2_BRADI|nr:hypothetical protein BRADI_4g27337v3 [Brachypodium distachyon]